MQAAVSLLLSLFIVAVSSRPLLPQELDKREIFAKAHTFYAAGHLSQAQELFQNTHDPKFPLADYSLYYLGLIAFHEKNWDLARQRLTQLKRRYPQSIWYHHTELQLAKIDLAEKKALLALPALKSLANKNVKKEIAEEALYRLAQAHEAQGEPHAAFLRYHELRDAYPLSRWVVAARKEQVRLKTHFPNLFGFDTLQSLSDEADRLVREREHAEAEVLYHKLLNNVTEPVGRLALLTKLAGLYLSVRRRNEAIPILQQIFQDYPETQEAPRALYQVAQIFWNRNDNAQALVYFNQLMERYPTNAHSSRARYAAADIYESFGNPETATQLYSQLPKQMPWTPVRDDAIWRLAWLHYRAGAFHEAAANFKTLAGEGQTRLLRLAAMYWQARSTEKLNDGDAAKQLYGQVAKAGDESYYQILALRGLERLGVVVEIPKIQTRAPSPDLDPPLTPESSFHLIRARELTALSLSQLAVAELDEAERRSRKQSRLLPVLMREYFRNQAYGRSLAIANQLPGSHVERDLYRFPLAFWDLIQTKAQERGLDPHLVLALIRQESLFDAQARSPASALGLMQLLPSTAARIAKQIGLPPPSNHQLFEPELNLTLGTQYLKDLLQRYANSWFKAIAAYNAGEAAVDRWEKEIITDDIEEFVERIPYVETRAYVKLVMRNHQIYKKLYETQK